MSEVSVSVLAGLEDRSVSHTDTRASAYVDRRSQQPSVLKYFNESSQVCAVELILLGYLLNRRWSFKNYLFI